MLTQETFLQAIGRAAKAKAGTGSVGLVDGLPPFLAAQNLKPFIRGFDAIDDSHHFSNSARGPRFGYDAELLPKVCKVYLRPTSTRPSRRRVRDSRWC